MKTYIIPQQSGDIEIIDPIIEIIGLSAGKLTNVDLDFVNNIIKLNVRVKTPQSNFCIPLYNIEVETMALGDGSLLQTQVEMALDEQFLVIN